MYSALEWLKLVLALYQIYIVIVIVIDDETWQMSRDSALNKFSEEESDSEDSFPSSFVSFKNPLGQSLSDKIKKKVYWASTSHSRFLSTR